MAKSRYPATMALVLLATLLVARVAHAQTLDDLPRGPVTSPPPGRVMDLPAPDPARVPVISSVTLDATARLLATAGDDHVVKVWDVQKEEVLRKLSGHTGWVRAVVFSPLGGMLATAGDDRRINLYEAGASKPVRSLETPDVAIRALAFSPDGLLLAAAGFDDKIRIHDARTGQMVRELDAPGGDIRAVAFSPDGAQLAAAGRSGRIRLWRPSDWRAIGRDLEGHRGRVYALVYSPDSTQLASAGDDRVVRLWDTATGAPRGTMAIPGCKLRALAFCGAGRLAAGGSDNLIHVLDLTAKRELRTFAGHTGSVAALAWDATDRTIVSGGFDTTVRFWRLRRDEGADRLSRRPDAAATIQLDR